MKAIKNKIRAAFTLIELLVVIVIIGILMAVLFPAIADALKGAKANALLQQGSSFAKGLVAADIDGTYPGEIYPLSTGTNIYANSTRYFKFVIKDELVSGQNFSLFGGGGCPPITSTDETLFRGRNNAWMVSQDVKTVNSDTIPFMISRNLKDLPAQELPDGTVASGGVNIRTLIENSTDGKLAFNNSHLCVVTRSGSGSVVHKARDLGPGKASKLNPTNKKLKLLLPGADNDL